MNLKIVNLMKAQKRDLPWLQDALQSAIELELSTLPPYHCGYWALKDHKSYPATQIFSIVKQEMLHFGLACNMLSATGKQPKVLEGYADILKITYPGPLPGGVVPKCDPSLIPCDPPLEVKLGFSDFKAFAYMCLRIEYPENPVPKPTALEAVEQFPSIGEFYDAVLEGFRDNNAKIPYTVTNQRKGALGVFLVDGLPKAIAAIQLIQQQGEGGDRNPFYGGTNLSHFYAFGELYFGRKYVFNAATETGDWTGDPISITDADVYKMTPVPKGGYSAPPTQVTDFDGVFTQMLTKLESAWSGGGAAALSSAIGLMTGPMRDQANQLLAKQIQRTDGQPGIYGPQFQLAKPQAGPVVPGPGGVGRAAGPVSFAADIKPLFRQIDIDHMQAQGYSLDDYAFMSDPADSHANANSVFDALKNRRMPPGGPFWSDAQLNLYSRWMSGGYKA
jgi:hypothetical protein